MYRFKKYHSGIDVVGLLHPEPVALAANGARACYSTKRGLATCTMKVAGLSLLCGICFISFARADLTIVQKVEGPGQSGDVTIKIKGEKERIESASQPTRIIDGKTGEMLNLMNDQKAFVRISAEQMKAAAETIAKFDGKNQTAERPKLTPTGKKETVNGYETDQYVYETPKFKATFWVATKYPDAASILKQMQAPISEAWKPSNMGMPEYRDFTGVPIKTVVSLGGNEVTTTLTSLKQDPLSDSEFSVPKDFQEVKPPETGEAPRPSEKKSPTKP
jgi:hypothetical protein